MRRLGLLILICICAGTAFGRNESVAAISYNPSRLGAYTHLKAVTTATLAGGVDTTINDADVNIKSRGTVSIADTNENRKCVANACDTDNLNTIGLLAPKSTAQNAITSAVMTNAVMKKANANPGNNDYTIDGASQPSAAQGTNILLAGGTLKANADSYINNFNTSLDKYIAALKKLKIAATSLEEKADFHAMQSFTFGKIKVTPRPTACRGTGSKCVQYKFVERLNTADSKKYKVLAVKIQ